MRNPLDEFIIDWATTRYPELGRSQNGKGKVADLEMVVVNQ